MADYAAQVARAGWQGLSAWDLDDALHSVHGHKVPPDDLTLKIWGFFNSQAKPMGHPEDENLRPWFYPWSLMSRLFHRGCRIVAAGPAAADCRVLAATADNGRELSLMVVNQAAAARAVRLKVAAGGRRALTVYHYFEADRPTDAEGFPRPAETRAEADLGAGLDVDLPGRGVVFLTTQAAGPMSR
jgi:hypothetical protein